MRTISAVIVLNSELVEGLLYGQLFKTEYTLSDGSTLWVHSIKGNVPITANDDIMNNKQILFLSNSYWTKNSSNAKTHSEPLHPGAMQPWLQIKVDLPTSSLDTTVCESWWKGHPRICCTLSMWSNYEVTCYSNFIITFFVAMYWQLELIYQQTHANLVFSSV